MQLPNASPHTLGARVLPTHPCSAGVRPTAHVDCDALQLGGYRVLAPLLLVRCASVPLALPGAAMLGEQEPRQCAILCPLANIAGTVRRECPDRTLLRSPRPHLDATLRAFANHYKATGRIECDHFAGRGAPPPGLDGGGAHSDN